MRHPQIVMPHHQIGAAMVNQNHQIVIDTLQRVSMIEEAQVAVAAAAEAIVTVIHLETIMTEKKLHMMLLVQATTAALVMVTQHPATVVLPQKEMVTACQEVAVLATVAVAIHLVGIHLVVIHLVAKLKKEVSAIPQVTQHQETKALIVITN